MITMRSGRAGNSNASVEVMTRSPSSWMKGRLGRFAAGGDQDAVGLDLLGLAAVLLDFEGVGVDEGAKSVEDSDAVLLHQEVHAGDGLVDDLLFAGNHPGKINLQLLPLDAVEVELLAAP